MTKKQTTVITVLTLIAIALLLLLSRQLWFRLDITRDSLNTISPVSRNLHTEIADTVQVTYFISDRLRAIHPVPGEIEDFLREYSDFSRGRIRLVVKDPVRANMASTIERMGMAAQQIQTMDADQASVATVYSGILIEYLDQVSVLPWVFSTETLEYELTSRIRAMVRGTPRILGVIVGGAETNPRLWEDSYSQLHNTFIQAGYQVRTLYRGQEIPDNLSALLVLDGVETLDEDWLRQIDLYMQNGGRAMFTAKAVGINLQGDLGARKLEDQGLLAMLESWGITVQPEIVMDKTALLMQYQTPSPTGGMVPRIAQNPQWIGVLPENGNPGHPISARFGGVDLYWANPLVLSPPQGIEAQELFTTTDDAWTMREPFVTSPDATYMMDRDSADTATGKRILGASLSGIFPARFENPESGGESAEPEPGRIVVIGESDFATSMFFGIIGTQRNLNFMVQAADWLANDDDLISIRSRVTGSGQLDRISDPLARSAAINFAKIVNIFLIPVLVILAGIFISARRKAAGREREAAGHVLTDGKTEGADAESRNAGSKSAATEGKGSEAGTSGGSAENASDRRE